MDTVWPEIMSGLVVLRSDADLRLHLIAPHSQGRGRDGSVCLHSSAVEDLTQRIAVCSQLALNFMSAFMNAL
jgi:hypothetical protein